VIFMTQDDLSDSDLIPNELPADELKYHLLKETAPLSWPELAPFFARGQLIAVAESLNFLEVAIAISKDNSADFQRWMAAGEVRLVDDALAQQWNDTQPTLLTVVIAPWVLAQPMPSQSVDDAAD
jgi:hypothetical protein